MSVVFPDALEDLRAWLRTHPDLKPLHGARVFYRLPDPSPKTKPLANGYIPPCTAPCMRLYRSGGGVQPGEAPLQDLRLGLEAWGWQGSDYPALRQLVTATESAFHQMQNNISGTTLLQYGQVTTAFDSPDPEYGSPRYVLDVLVTCRTA